MLKTWKNPKISDSRIRKNRNQNPKNSDSYYYTELFRLYQRQRKCRFYEGGANVAWFKLPEELLHLHLPYSAVILAAILYDADVKYTQHILIDHQND